MDFIDRSKPALIAASIIAALVIYLFGQGACWHDSGIYTFYARHLFDPLARVQVADRDPLYPFLIWLTGYSSARSLQGILLLQAIFAASTPLLVCLTLAPLSKRLALIVAWVALISAIPFVFETQLFTDQLHMFLLLSLAYSATQLCLNTRLHWLYATAILTGLLTFCRPTYWLLLPFTAWLICHWGLQKRNEKPPITPHSLAAIALMIALFLGNSWERSLPNHLLASQNLPPVKTSFVGHQLMWNVYRYAGGIKEAYNPEDGSATREFLRRSLLAFQQCQRLVGGYKHCLGELTVKNLRENGKLAEATQSAEATMRTFFYYPRYLGWAFFMNGLSATYWQTPEDENLLTHVYFEQITHHPFILIKMLSTGLSELVLTSYYTYNANDDYGYEPYNYDGRQVPQVAFMPALRIQNCPGEPEMNIYANYRYISPGFADAVQHIFEITYIPLTIVTGVLFLVAACWYGWMMLLRKHKDIIREAIVFFLLFAIYWLPNGVMVMMVMMQFRYQACTALLPLMGTGIFLYRMWVDYQEDRKSNR